ncbi:MAG: hypothetical protein DRG27_06565 [Deltaproteobacteria bacterium]|nr:MAG: hypothetical protein DRG27_06565 [Deltaproteobacteria bacterium]
MSRENIAELKDAVIKKRIRSSFKKEGLIGSCLRIRYIIRKSRIYLTKRANDTHKIFPNLVCISTRFEIIRIKSSTRRYKKGKIPCIVPEYMFKKSP